MNVNDYFNAGQVAHSEKQYKLAEELYNQALTIEPDNPETHYALGYICTTECRYEEAAVHFTYAMNGDDRDIAQYNRALCLLSLGKYKQGFHDYEARLNLEVNKKSILNHCRSIPKWSGQSCNSLYVISEQGFGDIIQFSRFVKTIKCVNKIYFAVPDSIYSLMAFNFNSASIEVVKAESVIETDYYIPLISLANILPCTPSSLPELTLKAEPEYIEKWAQSFPARDEALRIAICYSGRESKDDPQVIEWNNRRSISLEHIKSILEVIPKVCCVPLKPELNPDIKTWSDTAAIIENADLVISIDSGPVHLAAAMGKPVYMLNHKHTCWRWNLTGYTTPWYKNNLRIFRQKDEGNWWSPINELKEELKKYVCSYS